MTGTWPGRVSVKAASLALLCPKLAGGKALSLILVAGFLILDGGVFSLPAKRKRRRAE